MSGHIVLTHSEQSAHDQSHCRPILITFLPLPRELARFSFDTAAVAGAG
jgi:hypothetical protein